MLIFKQIKRRISESIVANQWLKDHRFLLEAVYIYLELIFASKIGKWMAFLIDTE